MTWRCVGGGVCLGPRTVLRGCGSRYILALFPPGPKGEAGRVVPLPGPPGAEGRPGSPGIEGPQGTFRVLFHLEIKSKHSCIFLTLTMDLAPNR